MNICIISTSYPPEDAGGIGTYTYNLAKGLTELGHNIHVITKTAGDEKEELLEGVNVYRFGSKYIPALEAYFPGLAWSRFVSGKIAELDKKHRVDIVEFPNWEGPGFWYLRKRSRKPAVTRLHTPYFESLMINKNNENLSIADRFTCWIEKAAALESDRLTSSTAFHRDCMSRAYHINSGDIELLPLGIELKDNNNFSVNKREPVKVLFVSRIEKRKGALTLLEAIPKVIDRISGVEFILIGKDRPHAPGDIYFKDYFMDKFSAYKEKARFLGHVSNKELNDFYQNCDILAVPSVYESFGLIYLEAMNYGKPVIGCKVGGVPEVVKDGETGILINPNNADELSEALIRLIKDPGLRESMGKSAARLAADKFSHKRMAKNTETLYRRVIEQFSLRE